MERDPKVGDVLIFDNNRDTLLDLDGFFVVEDIWFGGGGTGHGPHDIYPHGLHVYTRQLDKESGLYDPDGREFVFTVSGSFGSFIDPKYITVVNKMIKIVTFEY